eukprot:TRINITY_DN10655_c0_g1_i1.p1 TRINITY_DN10655_c0_g1~~TRINITY_DN10655_c0_g1_i1.p1  ORF type:complete len:366 (+),score=56.53 TRINITY_DN10655_c0_g1_i1:50-1147(+)
MNTALHSLVDLCLFTICKHIDQCQYISKLPEYLRNRLLETLKVEGLEQTKQESLNLTRCNALTDDQLKNITGLQNLRRLSVSGCDNLTAYGMAYVGQLQNLTALHLNHCTKFSLGFHFLPSFTKITSIEASFCEIQDPAIPFIAKLPSLTRLNLMCNRITDDGVASLANATTLKDLTLSMNPLITDKSVEHLLKLVNLKILNLNFCRLLTSNGIQQLRDKLPGLALEINGCDKAMTETKARPLILLAEDSPVQARIIRMVLERYNFDVEIAANGEMALEMFRANPNYDLILMDVMMPVMDGVSSVKLIREHEINNNLKRTPIIIQTATNNESQRSICLEAGASEVLSKPLDRAAVSLAKELMEKI